jgi:hypothetical protein
MKPAVSGKRPNPPGPVTRTMSVLQTNPLKAHTRLMADKTYLVTLKPPQQTTQRVTAASFAIQGEHLVFADSQGKLAALFLLEIVASWNEI